MSAAVREHLRKLCLKEFPCGAGSWVRAPAGAAGGTRGSEETGWVGRGGWDLGLEGAACPRAGMGH